MGEVLRDIGKIQIWRQIIFGTLFACSLFFVASMTITKKEIVRNKAIAKVINKKCGNIYFKKKDRYQDCTLTVSFTTKDNKNIQTKVGTVLKNSQTISNTPVILYAVNNPNDAILNKDKPIPPKYIASGASSCGILLLVFVYLNYTYRKSKTWQTYSGVTGTADIVSSVFNND